MISRTKLFLIAYFFPAWIASLMMWGDDRTSAKFQAAPPLFYQIQFLMQFVAILLLFLPFRIKKQPGLFGVFLSIVIIASLALATPTIEAEFILINGSMVIAIIAMFVSIAQPSATFRETDIGFLFILFAGGFALQIYLFLAFGLLPSHSIEEIFIRFNGITNDSLASGFIISLFIPWAVTTRFAPIKISILIGEAFASGSLFSVVLVPLAIFAYLLYKRMFGLALTILALTSIVVFYFFASLLSILEIKLESIVIHLRFFLNLLGANYRQSTIACSEEFCESFVEAGLYLSPVYTFAFFGLLVCFIVPLLRSVPLRASSSLVRETLWIYAAAILAGSLVHPVPLIPFVIPLFLILTTLYLRDAPSRGGGGSAYRPQPLSS